MQVSRFPSAFGLYEMLVLVFWAALWVVWPRQGMPPRADARPMEPQVRFVRLSDEGGSLYRRPDLIAHAPLAEDAWGAAEGVWPNALPRRGAERSHPLSMEEARATFVGRSPPALEAGLPVPGYAPESPALEDGTVLLPRAVAVRSEVCRALRAAGVRLTDEVLASLAAIGATAWRVTVSLAFETPGRPAEVFVEAPCKDEKVNAAVVAAMRTLRAPDASIPCRGWVTVNYGGR
jgi:hypothetical protein